MQNKGRRLTPDELEYIRAHCLTTSDDKIGAALNRDPITVMKARRKMGIQKKVGGGLLSVDLRKNLVTGKDGVIPANQNFSEEFRKEFYKTQFTNTLYYKNLKEQFTEEEIRFYLEEYSSLCLQFEDIVATEKRQIDEYIKLAILGNRILKHIRTVEIEIASLQKEIEDFRKRHDVVTDEEAQERDRTLTNLLFSMSGHSKAIANDYQKNLDMKNKLLEELDARRKDRVDQISKRGTTFLSLLEDFRNKQTREKQGKHMELVRMAKEKKKNEWRKPHRFPDGSEDNILLDEQSVFPKKDIVTIDQNCKAIDYCLKNPSAKVLLIDNALRRQQFFADVFNGWQIDFADNVAKGIEKVDANEYDLICFDYDLGFKTPSTLIAETIVEQNKSPNAKILIHSMNKIGAKVLEEKLSSRETEVYPFEDIVKNLGEKYRKLKEQKNGSDSIGTGENAGNSVDEAQG